MLRVAVQSEQGILEDRCSEMEVSMETLRQHNVQLQKMLTQVSSSLSPASRGMIATNKATDNKGTNTSPSSSPLLSFPRPWRVRTGRNQQPNTEGRRGGEQRRTERRRTTRRRRRGSRRREARKC